MLKLIILTTLFSLTSFAQTDCYENLTGGLGDSAFFTQHSSDVYSNSSESLDEQMVYNSITKTLREQNCSDKIDQTKIKCTEALATTICRLNMKYGYFIVLKDYVDTVNIIFNRWD